MERFLFLFCFLHLLIELGGSFSFPLAVTALWHPKKNCSICYCVVHISFLTNGRVVENGGGASAKAKRVMLATILYSVLCLLSRVEKYMKQACRTFVFLA
jgi:hypothetical protein